MPFVLTMLVASFAGAGHGLLALQGPQAASDPQATSYLSLVDFEPDHHRYAEAERCGNCHEAGGDILRRAVGVELSSGAPVITGNGWLSSVHARSQDHDDRVNTACAWCHAPTAPGATEDEAEAVPIQKGAWQGVTCGACHPVGLDESDEKSLVTNLTPGLERSDPASFTFIDRSDPLQLNAQCQFCHHEYHDLVAAKAELMDAGALRCIDCHMAGYAVAEGGLVERFHNFKVEENGPLSCSGRYGTEGSCHADASTDWMRASIPTIKGPRKAW
jgi:hypothetical protein